MTVHTLWIGSFLALSLLAVVMSRTRAKGVIPGLLIDSRGRLSLSQLQMTLWTLVGLSLLTAVFLARLLAGVTDPLGVDIPDELLAAMGISLGSGVVSGAIKAGKDVRGVHIKDRYRPHLAQLYFVEEGQKTADFVDVTRLQNLWLTIIVLIAYVYATWTYIGAHPDVASLTALPGFDGTLVTLFGISHAAYIGGKMPDRA
jgi:hypothetical protein